MIWGFPGSTDRYLSSYGVKNATDLDQPARVKIRRAKLDVYEKYQTQNEAVDLMYSAKHAQVANYWKYFMGQTRGLKRLDIEGKKRGEEEEREEGMKRQEEKIEERKERPQRSTQSRSSAA